MDTLFLPQLLEKTAESRWVSGLSNAGKSWFLSKWLDKYKKSVLVVARGAREAEVWRTDLESFCNRKYPVLFFPEWEEIVTEGVIGSLDLIGERWDVIEKITRQQGPLVLVTSIGAVLNGMLPRDIINLVSFQIAKGKELIREDLFRWLLDNGYERTDCVEYKGEFAHRGGIIDVFPPNSDWPVRVELAGTIIVSRRFFHPQTQCSLSRPFGPERENLQESKGRGLTEGEVPSQSSALDCVRGRSSTTRIYPIDEPAVYKKYFDKLVTLETFFQDGLIVLDEPLELQQRADDLARISTQFCSWQKWWQKTANQHKLFLSLLAQEKDGITVTMQALDYLAAEKKTPDMLAKSRARVFEQIREWLKEKYQVSIWCNNIGERGRLLELLQERKVSSELKVEIGRLSGGFVYPGEKLAVVSDEEIFGRYKVRMPRRKFKGYGVPLKEFTELEPGDYVVHVDHGIGKYLGVKKQKDEEFLVIQYADKIKLYVPIDQSNLVERYLGLRGRVPKLSKLDGTRWLKTKLRVERALQDLAAELLGLQAERQALPGISFIKDTVWQKEMEDAFIYEETPDQLQAVSEVKTDMEHPKPMDRLLCGDVGYGKTEVAVRAAFKTVMNGKQVAVLVPTTILAQQHYRTFSDRMADYPVVVEMLSRFRTDKEQKNIVKVLNEGGIDIVIGTHRLIQSDVKFKDLGLVIVDEEQRFGVRHKERLKKLRAMIDVLTLTATPIPRTLYMSLVGLRDMSVINTPPQDRLAVETIVVEYNEDLIRKVILRELNREGQIYFLHNRVETIDKVTKRLQRLIPEAKFITGHGQMNEELLASVMEEFVQGKADVLVCTTIIQSGLDIPNVNTIIINDAHRFGLADLYQLRGRVGRFKHQAYAYLLLPHHLVLAGAAKKRLKAIKDFSHLGAGFKIAMQDLEIRGAGNILGSQQHGYIQAVGFDMYCKLLRKNVLKLQGKKVQEVYEVKLEIDIFGLIPIDYIPSNRIRIDFYKRIAEVLTQEDLQKIKGEMQDRFGPLSQETVILLGIAELKLVAIKAKIKEIKELRNKFYIICLDGTRLVYDVPGPGDKLKWLESRLCDIIAQQGGNNK